MLQPLKVTSLTLDEVRWLHSVGAIETQAVEITDPVRGLVALPRHAAEALLDGTRVVAALDHVAHQLGVSSGDVDAILSGGKGAYAMVVHQHPSAKPDPYKSVAFRNANTRTAAGKYDNWTDACGYFRALTGFDLPVRRKEMLLCGDLGEALAFLRQIRMHTADVPTAPHPDALPVAQQQQQQQQNHTLSPQLRNASVVGSSKSRAPPRQSAQQQPSHHLSLPRAKQQQQQPVHRGGVAAPGPTTRHDGRKPVPKVHRVAPLRGNEPRQRTPPPPDVRSALLLHAATPTQLGHDYNKPLPERRSERSLSAVPWQSSVADAATSPPRTPEEAPPPPKTWSAADWFLSPFLTAVTRVQAQLRFRKSKGHVQGTSLLRRGVLLAQQRYRFLLYQRAMRIRAARHGSGDDPALLARRLDFAPLRGQCTRCLPVLDAFRQVLIAHPEIDEQRLRGYYAAVCPRCKTLLQCMIRWRPGAEELHNRRLQPHARTVQAHLRAMVSGAVRRRLAIIAMTPKFKFPIRSAIRAVCFTTRLRRTRVQKAAEARLAGHQRERDALAAEEEAFLQRRRSNKNISGGLLETSISMRYVSVAEVTARASCRRCLGIHELMQADLRHRRNGGDALVARYAEWMCKGCRTAALGPLQALRTATVRSFVTCIKALHFIVRLLSRPRLARIRRNRKAYVFRHPGGPAVPALYWRVIMSIGLGGGDDDEHADDGADSCGSCNRCRSAFEPLWRSVKVGALGPTALVPAEAAGADLYLPASIRAARTVAVIPVAENWMPLLCAACSRRLTLAAESAVKPHASVSPTAVLGARLRAARALLRFTGVTFAMVVAARLKRRHRRVPSRLGTFVHGLDCKAGCAPLLEALAERWRLRPPPRRFGADVGAGAKSHAEATRLRSRVVAVAVAVGKPWPLALSGARASLQLTFPCVVRRPSGDPFAEPWRDVSSIAASDIHHMCGGIAQFHGRVAPQREASAPYLNFLCDACHDRILDVAAVDGRRSFDDRRGEKDATLAIAVDWNYATRVILAHRRLNTLVRIGVLRVLRLSFGRRRACAIATAVGPVPALDGACPRCRPLLEQLVVYLSHRWKVHQLTTAALDVYAELLCPTCRGDVLYRVPAAVSAAPRPASLGLHYRKVKIATSLRDLLALQRRVVAAAVLVRTVVVRRALAARFGHRQANPTPEEVAGVSTAGPPVAFHLPVATCARCGPIVQALHERLLFSYHGGVVGASLQPPKRTAAEMRELPMPASTDYAHVIEGLNFTPSYLHAMCYRCRSRQDHYIRRTLVPRFHVANAGVIRVAGHFFRRAMRMRATAAPRGECQRCHPVKEAFRRHIRACPFRGLAPRVLRRYAASVCIACRTTFAASVKTQASNHTRMVVAQSALRHALMRRRVLPGLARSAAWVFGRINNDDDAAATHHLGPRLQAKTAARRWAYTPGRALAAFALWHARRPHAAVPCAGRCATLTVAFCERVATIPVDESFLKARAVRYSAAMCSECRKGRGTLHPDIATYVRAALQLPAASVAPGIRAIATLFLMVRFVQQRRRWVLRWRRRWKELRSVQPPSSNAEDGSPITTTSLGCCPRCWEVVRELQSRIWISSKRVSRNSDDAAAGEEEEAGGGGLATTTSMGMSKSHFRAEIEQDEDPRATEAGEVVFFAMRYEFALCAEHRCRPQRLKWITAAMRSRRLAVWVAARWRWLIRYPSRLVTATVRHAAARDAHDVCSRCAPLLVMWETRRGAVKRKERTGRWPSWKVAAELEKAAACYEAALCSGCQAKVGTTLLIEK